MGNGALEVAAELHSNWRSSTLKAGDEPPEALVPAETTRLLTPVTVYSKQLMAELPPLPPRKPKLPVDVAVPSTAQGRSLGGESSVKPAGVRPDSKSKQVALAGSPPRRWDRARSGG